MSAPTLVLSGASVFSSVKWRGGGGIGLSQVMPSSVIQALGVHSERFHLEQKEV